MASGSQPPSMILSELDARNAQSIAASRPKSTITQRMFQFHWRVGDDAGVEGVDHHDAGDRDAVSRGQRVGSS